MLKGPGDMVIPFAIKDNSDNRGFSFSLDAGLNNFHIVSIRPGKIRGDHMHDHNEVVIVLGGKGMAKIDIGDAQNKETLIVNNDFYPILFPAFTRHVIRNIGDRDFYLICFFTN